MGFFDSLRMEVQYRGVRIVNICPGPVQSEIALHAFTEVKGKEHGDKERSWYNTHVCQPNVVLN